MLKQARGTNLTIPHLIDAQNDLAFKPDVDANSFFVIADVQTQDLISLSTNFKLLLLLRLHSNY